MAIVNGSVQQAYYTEAQWQAWNGVLLAGQKAYSSDVFYGATNSPKFKVGNGTDVWADLDYHPDGSGGSGITELTGDVTTPSGSGSQVATIANDAVTFAKMQNISTDKLLGRDTAGSGNVEEIGLANGLQFSGTGNAEQGGSLNKDTAIEAGSHKWTMKTDISASRSVGVEKHVDGTEHFGGAIARNTGTNLYAVLKATLDTATGNVIAELTEDDLTALKQLGFRITNNVLQGVSRVGSVWTFVDSSGQPWFTYDEADGALILGHDTADRPSVGTVIQNTPVMPDLGGGGTQMVVVDNNGLLSAQAIPSGGSGILQNVWIDKVIESAVGSGYSFSTESFFQYITIPGGTLQSGDYLIIRTGGQRTGTGNAAFFTSITNTPDSTASGSLYGSHGANFGSYVGTNFCIFLGAAGIYLMPNGGSPASVPPVDEFATGGAGTTATGHTQVNSGNTLNYANPLYVQNWAIADNTSTIYSKFILVEHYRP